MPHITERIIPFTVLVNPELTVLDDDSSHERGYFAGVDDYLSKRAPDAKVVAAIRAAS